MGGKRARCSYEFHERASLLRLLKTVEMLVPAEKEARAGLQRKGTGQSGMGGRGGRRKDEKSERMRG